MINTLFSIITPVYNSEKYISIAVNSVIDQEFVNYELIIVNDCSSDKTLSICNSLSNKHKNIKIINQKYKTGIGECRNIGINKANGDYIMFLDSDDYLSKGCLLNLSKIVQKNGNYDCILFKYISIRGNGNKKIYNNFSKSIIENAINDEVLEHYSNISENENSNFGYCWFFLSKRTFLLSNHIYFSKFSIYEDKIFVLKLFKFAKYYSFCDTVCYSHILRNDSISYQLDRYEACLSAIKCVSEMCKILNDTKSSKIYQKFLYKQIAKTFSYIKTEILHLNNSQIHQLSRYCNINFINNLFLDKSLIHSQFYQSIKLLGYYKGFSDYKNLSKNRLLDFIENSQFNKIYLFCVNRYSESIYYMLKNVKIKVSGVFDNDNSIGPKTSYGLPIIHPENFIKTDINDLIIIICKQDYQIFNDINLQLTKIGFNPDKIFSLDFETV